MSARWEEPGGGDPGQRREEIRAGWDVMGAGHIQGMHRSRVKGIHLQPPCTGLRPEEEEQRYHWQCCPTAIPSHGVALKTTEP